MTLSEWQEPGPVARRRRRIPGLVVTLIVPGGTTLHLGLDQRQRNMNEALRDAVLRQDLHAVQRWLVQGADPNERPAHDAMMSAYPNDLWSRIMLFLHIPVRRRQVRITEYDDPLLH